MPLKVFENVDRVVTFVILYFQCNTKMLFLRNKEMESHFPKIYVWNKNWLSLKIVIVIHQ